MAVNQEKKKLDLRSTDSKTVVLKGGFSKAGCSASQAHVTPLSELVGRNLMVEVVVIRLSGLLSSTSCLESVRNAMHYDICRLSGNSFN
jgi:hypothetical protein